MGTQTHALLKEMIADTRRDLDYVHAEIRQAGTPTDREGRRRVAHLQACAAILALMMDGMQKNLDR